ncbi:hypothetical protein LBMAG42_12000 [Deltaproteobacteria bacterium]|nr:hypothetical protein LBMAG42_12000 [Deltaproteobacteria bacterium]
MLSLSERIAAAAPGSILEIGLDEPPVVETLRIDKPLSLVGVEGAVLRGFARDALLRVLSPRVVIENVRFERIPRSDGTPSWGSGVVVEDAGHATLRCCAFTAAADAWVVEPQGTLLPGEAWTHAGLDVRGTGHAVVGDCRFEGCSTALSVSIYPADKVANLVARGVVIEGGLLGVKALANARVSLRDLSVGGGTDTAVKADNGAQLTGADWKVQGARVGIWMDDKASLKLENVGLDAETAGIVVRANASATIKGGRIARAYAAAEVHGMGELRLADVEIGGVKLGIWACDAASAVADTLRFTGDPPEWGAYADCAATVTSDAPLPGECSSAGVASVSGGTCAPWDRATWVATLRDRTNRFSPSVRAALSSAYQRRLHAAPGALTEPELSSLIDAIFQWGELGENGLREPLAVALRPVHRFAIPSDVAAMVVVGETAFVSHADGKLRAWSEAGELLWTVACKPARALVAANGVLVVIIPNHSSEILRAFDPETGALKGSACTGANVAAMALGSTIELSTYDSTGHPTDRCTYRERWTLPDTKAPTECMAQGAELLPPPAGFAQWDWVSPDMGGPGRVRAGRVFAPGCGEVPGLAVAQIAGFTVVALEEALRMFDAERKIIAVFREPGVGLLAMGRYLWLATTGRELSIREILHAT